MEKSDRERNDTLRKKREKDTRERKRDKNREQREQNLGLFLEETFSILEHNGRKIIFKVTVMIVIVIRLSAKFFL